MPDTTTDEATALTERESLAIIGAMSRMPYAADTRVPIPAARNAGGKLAPITADDVLDFLNGLANVLRGAGDRANQTELELRELQSQQRAMRRFLGLPEMTA